jgi:hypothetical protein
MNYERDMIVPVGRDFSSVLMLGADTHNTYICIVGLVGIYKAYILVGYKHSFNINLYQVRKIKHKEHSRFCDWI